jgi:hypothetical protein
MTQMKALGQFLIINCKLMSQKCLSAQFFYALLCDTSSKIADDASINVEQIVTGHSWLSRNSSWDNHNAASSQSGGKLIIALKPSNLQKQTIILKFNRLNGVCI